MGRIILENIFKISNLIAVSLLVLSVSTKANVLEEVVVTAQKREQSLQDVGIAVTAFTGDQIEKLGFDNSADIVAMAPNVSTGGSFAGQLQQFSIRGVTQNDFTDHTESPTALYVDDAYVASGQGQLFALYDVERVEILKGPQGTLFGRNATGGTVNIVTRKPEQEFSGFGKIKYGSENHVRFEGAVGGGISENLSARVSVLYNRFDEIYNNLAPGQDDVWNDDTLAGRAQLLWNINEDADLLLSVHGGRSEFSTSPYQSTQTAAVFDAQGRQINSVDISATETRSAIGPGGFNASPASDPNAGLLAGFNRPAPGGDFTGFRDPDAEGDDVFHDFADDDLNSVDSYGVTAKLSWDLEDSAVTTILDYKTLERDMPLDCDAGPTVINCFTVAEIQNMSAEFRWNGERDNFRWVTGLYYLHIDARVDANGLAVPTVSLTDQNDLLTDSYSIFGQVEYDFNPQWTLTAGVRATLEEKDYFYRSDVRASNAAATIFDGPILVPARNFMDESSDTLWTAKLQLDWKPNDDLLLYAGFNRGIKAGSFNAPFAGGAIVTNDQIPYKEEVLHAYEIGFKSTLFDGKARLNGSAFYYDYRDYQSFVFFGLTSRVSNNDAEYIGAELELIAAPTDNITLMLSGSYIDAEVKDVDLFTIPTDVKPAFTPEFQFSGLLRYEWPVLGGIMYLQGDFNYKDDFFYQLINFDSVKSDGGIIGNARIGYSTDDEKWNAVLAIENLADERYTTFGFDFSTFCGCNETAYNRPRWVSFTLSRNF
jgi:iron complex outermembrane recepter protein